MNDSRRSEVNRALADRRALMGRRILRGRIALICWAVLAALNLVLIWGSASLRLPISCTTADFGMMMWILYHPQIGAILGLLTSVLLPILMVLSAVVWKRDGVGQVLRTLVFLLLWADVILGLAAYIWNPAVLFGESDQQTLFAIANLLLHILLVWLISRARRAVDSLEILPEAEIEGDPFEEFRKK